VDGEFKPFKVDGNKSRAGVDALAARQTGPVQNFELEPCHAIWFTAECGHEQTSSTASLGVLMRTTSSTYFFAWLWAVSFVATALWGALSASPLPFPGLRNLASSEFLIPMSLYLLAAAGWYSTPRLITRGLLLAFRTVSVVLAFVGFIFTSVPFGIACAFLAHSSNPTSWSPTNQ
jgi:hypothetical protein